jgi:hypothetical protein
MCKGSKQRAGGEGLANDEGSRFRKYPPFDKMSLSNHKALGRSSLIAGIKLQSIISQRSLVVNRYLASLLGLALTFYSTGGSRNLALHKENALKIDHWILQGKKSVRLALGGFESQMYK